MTARHGLLLLALALAPTVAACTTPFEAAQKVDTIEAYQAFIKENPGSSDVTHARHRLAELKLVGVRKVGTLAAYETFVAEFPSGKAHDEAMELRKPLLVAEAERLDTAEAWQRVLDEYSLGDRKLMLRATREIASAKERGSVGFGELTSAKVNLAGDAKGALDGWRFTAPITNKGTVAASEIVVEITFPAADGKPLTVRQWPVVAPRLPEALPMPEGFAVPMPPGETRVWSFQAGNIPEGWTKPTLDLARVKWATEPAPAKNTPTVVVPVPDMKPMSKAGKAKAP